MPTIARQIVGRSFCSLCLTLALIAPATATEPLPVREFSADIVTRDPAGLRMPGAARIYVANLKVRIETTEAKSGFFLLGESGAALFVRPAQQVFMDAKQSTLLTQIFVPVDRSDACPQWRAAAQNTGVLSSGADWRCERVDTATIDASGTIEYRIISASQPSQRWIDSSLAFPVKLRAADGTTMALEHIRFETQPASLFTLPPNYRKLEPQALIERVKHSDVWVAPLGNEREEQKGRE